MVDIIADRIAAVITPATHGVNNAWLRLINTVSGLSSGCTEK